MAMPGLFYFSVMWKMAKRDQGQIQMVKIRFFASFLDKREMSILEKNCRILIYLINLAI
jgi:hypothetical protein